jgi:acetyl esterase
MTLAPESQFINDLVVGARVPGATPPSAPELRAAWVAMFAALPPTTLACDRADLEVAGRPAILLTPPKAGPGLLVWYHGGGWVIGSAELSLAECDQLAALAGCRVLTVDYRLAPEEPFPAAYDDAVGAVRWVLDHADDLQIDRRRIAVGGDSAGGNLAAAVAQHFGATLAGQLLVYPAVDASTMSEAHVTYGDGYLLDAATMNWFYEQYAGDDQRTDVRISPLLSGDDVVGLTPPAHVVVAECDPLRDDGLRYAQRLRDLGVPTTLDHHTDQMHGFFSLPSVLPGAQRAIATAASFLRQTLSPPNA